MNCKRFRIVITLLASFCAFFAYVCRLNLSLTIETMVPSPSSGEDDAPFIGVQVVDNCKQTSQDSMSPKLRYRTLISNEEHTFAWLASYQKCMIRPLSRNRSQKIIPQSMVLRSLHNQMFIKDFLVPNDNGNSDKTSKDSAEGSPKISTPQVPAEAPSIGKPEPDIELSSNKLDWSEEDKNDILGAFFWGYLVTQIPAARAAELLGPKPLFLVAGFGAGLLSILFPIAAKTGIYYAWAVRFLLGCSQGGLFPAAYVLLCNWLPKNERSNWLPVPSSFSRIGTIVMNIFLPIVVRVYDWEAVFYIGGGATLVWCAFFIIFGSNTPEQSYWITTEELAYIESNMEAKADRTPTRQGKSSSTMALVEDEKPQISWVKVITSKALLILSIAMFSSEWSNMLLLIKLPGFLTQAMSMEMEEISFWSSVLVAIYCFHYPFSGWCASQLEAAFPKQLTSLTVRKGFEVVAQTLQAGGCFMIAYYNDKIVVISALILMMLGRATVGGGQCLMPPELSKEYSGTVFAAANTLANVAGVLGPKTVTWMVEDPTSYESWFWLWILSGAVFIACGLIFIIFADNSPQDYRKDTPTEDLPKIAFR